MSSQDHLPQPATPRDPISGHGSLATAGNTVGLYLQQYFRSGWAFFIPYLAAYLLYAWLRWPVNPVDGGQWTVVPCLLHVYWALHAVHLTLGAFALRAWWRAGSKGQGAKGEERWGQPAASLTSLEYGSLPAANRLLSTGYRLLPWLCLALLFYIPGIYLEWPSDPWEHLRRISNWNSHGVITTHESWEKASYFLFHSFTGQLQGAQQMRWLNIFCVAAIILLCWQHYRLALALALSREGAFVFVVINLITFGNSAFSFTRYYSLSSSVLAQIAAVAFARACIVAMTSKTDREVTEDVCPWLRMSTNIIKHGIPLGFLLILAAYSHPQGLVIAALAVAAVLCHWLICRFGRLAVAALGVLCFVASLVCLQFIPRVPIVDSLRAIGWMNEWYGFDFFTPLSPALAASIQVLGVLGVANLMLGVWLCLRNHIGGWLTLVPWFALQLPFVSVPLAHFISTQSGPENMHLVHRIFFAIPAGLAAVVTAQQAHIIWCRYSVRLNPVVGSNFLFCAILLGLAIILIAPADRPWHNRLWNAFAVTPRDLELAHLWDEEYPGMHHTVRGNREVTILSTSPTGYIYRVFGSINLVEIARGYSAHSWPPTGDAIIGLRFLSAAKLPIPASCILLKPGAFYSTRSWAAQTSRHWLQQEAVLASIGTPELLRAARLAGFRMNTTHNTCLGIAYMEINPRPASIQHTSP